MERNALPRTEAPSGKLTPLELIAARQHGVVSRPQLIALGMSSAAIGRRIQSGRLRPVLTGVYRVGPLVGPQSFEMAAVLAGGPSAVLSHVSALSAWDLLRAGPGQPVHVTLIGRRARLRPGIIYHVAGSIMDAERTILDGVPITAPLRTLVDAAGILGSREIARAIAAAERLGHVSPAQLAELHERYRGRRGMMLLRTLVQSDADRAFTRSEAEERCLALLQEASLPRPHSNVPVGPYELDFFWPDANVAVEVDGWAYHGKRPQFENDRRKDNWLRGRGIEVVRLTWRQITRQPTSAAVQVGQALAMALARRSGRDLGEGFGKGPATSGQR